MNREEIMAMSAGSLLDELVAEKVMNWKVTYHTHKNGRESDYSYSSAITDKGRYRLIKPCKEHDEDGCFQPSTDIAAAWEVVSKFDYLYLYRWYDQPCDFIVKAGEWECKLSESQDESVLGIGLTAPEAIVKATLLAVIGVDK